MRSPFDDEEEVEDDEERIHPTDEELMDIFFKIRLSSSETYGKIAVKYARLILEVYGS